ncbi:MAG: hypothetical protein CSA62_09530 [Planctomycetota bacterium]|nr:MAG: hypothetical protein CSA62_09530 [Planctomycetota bacterium]
MDRAELTLARSMDALLNQQNSIASNLANMGSTAFKRQAGNTEPFEMVLNRQANREVVPVYRERTDWTQGDITYTGDTRNIALEGEGMLQVTDKSLPGQILLTRTGILDIDPEGFLTTGGRRVLGPAGNPIQVGGHDQFQITANGQVSDPNTGDTIGNLGRFMVEDPRGLEYLGDGIYRHNPQKAGKLRQDLFTLVRQKNLESSNVQSISEMVSMISVQRHFQAITKALSAFESATDQLNQLAQS